MENPTQKAPYFLSMLPHTSQSYCKDCKQRTSMLFCSQEDQPVFIICFGCKTVREVGVGPVERNQEPTLRQMVAAESEQAVQAQVEQGMDEAIKEALDAGRCVLTARVIKTLFEQQDNGKTSLENLMSGYGHHPKTVEQEVWKLVHEAIGPVGPFTEQAP